MPTTANAQYPRVVARGDFEKTTPHQLSVQKGETLYVIFRGFERMLALLKLSKHQTQN